MIWYWYSLCCFPGAHWLFRGKGCDCGEELKIETMQITLPSTRIEIMQPSLYLLGSKVISLGEEPLQGDSVLLELLEHKESHKVGILRPRTEREHGSWELAVWSTSSVWFLRPALRAKSFKISSPSALRGGLKSSKTGPLLERWPLTFRFWISWWLWWLFAIRLRSNVKRSFSGAPLHILWETPWWPGKDFYQQRHICESIEI